MKPSEKQEFTEVFEGTIFQAEMVKNLLENEDIEAFLKDQIIGTRNPMWSPYGGVKVIVSSLDYEAALSVVKEYEKNLG
ncbi:MAG: DUF2007 domain-containing protein [Bacteroidetes bacterium]|jgi:predicted transcriptional regulator|nr:DUF2007 domain-containing protein [Bacteroidota bacterium]